MGWADDGGDGDEEEEGEEEGEEEVEGTAEVRQGQGGEGDGAEVEDESGKTAPEKSIDVDGTTSQTKEFQIRHVSMSSSSVNLVYVS